MEEITLEELKEQYNKREKKWEKWSSEKQILSTKMGEYLCKWQNVKREYAKQNQFIKMYKDECEELKDKIGKARNLIQYIIDYGFDYDGLKSEEDLKGLIDMLVDYARKSKDILKIEEPIDNGK